MREGKSSPFSCVVCVCCVFFFSSFPRCVSVERGTTLLGRAQRFSLF